MAKRSRKPKTPKSAIKRSLFAHEGRECKTDGMGGPLAVLERRIDFGAIAEEVDAAAPRPSQERGGRPPYPTEVMVRILALKHLYNLADEALEFQLLDRPALVPALLRAGGLIEHLRPHHGVALRAAPAGGRCRGGDLRGRPAPAAPLGLHGALRADHRRHHHRGAAPALHRRGP